MSQAHPTDEQLSAALDGQDDGAAAHAAGCPSCRSRQEELRAVIGLVGAPVVVDEARREAAVAAAMRAPAFVTPAASRVADQAERRRQFNWAPLAAVAAVLVVAMLVVPRMLGGSADKDSMTTASQDESARLAEGAATGGGETGAVDGGDLGDLGDGIALRNKVQPVLGGGNDFDTGTEGAGGEGGTGAPAASGAPLVASPSSADGASDRTATPAAPCSANVRRDYGSGIGALVYTASARFQGTPGVVLGYQLAPPSERIRHRVFVLAVDDCRLLTVLNL